MISSSFAQVQEKRSWPQIGLYVIFVIFTALTLFRAPVPLTLATLDNAYWAYLYENLRLGHIWGVDILTSDGPLAALQNGLYAGGSVWMTFLWQIGGNLWIAIILVSTAWRFPWKSRVWLLGLFLVIAARIALFAPWMCVAIIGYTFSTQRESDHLKSFSLAVSLGFLGLSSIAHLILGAIALILLLITAPFAKTKITAVTGWLFALLLGWLTLGQPISGLWAWLRTGIPLMAATSELFRYQSLSTLSVWAGLVTLAVITTFFLPSTEGRRYRAGCMFITCLLWMAWKGIALQPFGEPVLFFGSGLFAAFVLLYRGASNTAVIIICILSLGGVSRANYLIIADGIGHLNRQIVGINLPNLFNLSSLRAAAKDQFNQYRPLYAQPRSVVSIAGGTVDILGESPAYAYYNDLKLQSRPAPIFSLARTPDANDHNVVKFTAKNGPTYVLQRLSRRTEMLPAIEDSLTQLALYRNYSIEFDENGFLLWKKQKESSEALQPILVASGNTTFGTPVNLPNDPHSETAYWLEIDLYPNFIGRLWSLIDDVCEPGLLLHTQTNSSYFYALPHTLSSRGFLLTPLIRGESDLIRKPGEAGALKIDTFSLMRPSKSSHFWGRSFKYRLYALPSFSINGFEDNTTVFAKRYVALNRLPVSTKDYFPAQSIVVEGRTALLAHPENEIELAATSEDRSISGKFGIISGAYQNGNTTDGVDFSVEYIGSNGEKKILFHRYLNPLIEINDRGVQHFSLMLPQESGGRVILHTYNALGRDQSWDWSYWAEIVIN